MSSRSVEFYQGVVRSIASLQTEVEWVEFKVNNKDPERIAKYISGLSNAATLCDRPVAYIVWGIKDDTHKIVGTAFDYRKAKKGNMELEVNCKLNLNTHNQETHSI
ncbi:MAG: helix-turn-helix domain-containing protein, partial [Pyramidobacter sp.]